MCRHLFYHLEGTVTFVVELLHRSPGLDITPVEPYVSTDWPIRSGETMGVFEAGVGLIGNLDLVAQVVMESLQISHSEVGFVSRYIAELDRQARVISLVGEEGGNTSHRVRNVVVHKFSKREMGRPVVLLIVDEYP